MQQPAAIYFVRAEAAAEADLLLVAQPELVKPVLQLVRRVITRHLLGLADLEAEQAHT